MNRSLTLRLMLKDWYLCRASLVLVALAGAFCVGLLYLRNSSSSLVGLTGALIAAVFVSILPPIQTIVNERKHQNLAFVMSLPISPTEYTASKILGNFAAFAVIWLVIAGSVIGTIARAGGFGGVIPLVVIVALVPFVAFWLMVSVAIISESELVTLITMGACNISYSFGWIVLMQVPGLSQNLKSPVPVWSTPVLLIIAGQLMLAIVCLGLTFFLQSRKTDFV
jgi:ABC-type transport system involved in multi-copper enzyme maturation permease subunit